MKILLVSKAIFPYRGGSAEITENLARQFSPEEMVVVGEARWLDPAPKQYQRSKDRPRFYYLPSEISLRGRGRRFFNWLIWLQLPWIVWRLTRIAKREGVDYIIGTFPTNYYCFAAYRVAKRLGLPFSSYFHNTLVENRSGFNRWFSARLQDKIFAASERVFVMSDGMADYYRRNYAEQHKFLPLVHTFLTYPPRESYHFLEKETYDLVLIGNINASNLEATRRFIAAVKSEKKYRINLYTHVPPVLLKSRGVDTDAIIHRGFVDSAAVIDKIRECDIAVLTHGFSGSYSQIEYETIFPTRTIPFLLSGRPILAHCPSFSFIAKTLTDHDAAEVITQPDQQAILRGLNTIIQQAGRREEILRNASKMAEQYFGANVAAYLRSQLTHANGEG